MKTLCLPVLAVALFSCGTVPRVDVMPAYGEFSVDGSLGASTGGASVVSQDLASLGIDGAESGSAGRATLKWLGFQLALSGFGTDYSGSGTTTAAIDINGDTIMAGAAVDSSLDLHYTTAALTFDIFPGSTFDLGLGLGITAIDMDLRLTETMASNTLTADEQIPLPQLSLRSAANFGRFGLYGDLGWISGNYGDFDGELLDIDVAGRLRLFGSGKRLVGHATVGYRYVDTNFLYDDGGDTLDVDLLSDGPYLGITFSF
ncbi:MAG: hypothetical protein ACI8QZ_003951 [Chlamydiales bacterium]|jgi:hypothetical protein